MALFLGLILLLPVSLLGVPIVRFFVKVRRLNIFVAGAYTHGAFCMKFSIMRNRLTYSCLLLYTVLVD